MLIGAGHFDDGRVVIFRREEETMSFWMLRLRGDVTARVMGDLEVALGEETVIVGTAILRR